MSGKKTIKINPNFLKVSNKKKTKKERKKKPVISGSMMKSNNIKKRLLEKIKARQQELRKLETEENKSSEDIEEQKFRKSFKESMSYLQKMIRQKKEKKRRKKTRKSKFKMPNNQLTNVKNNLLFGDQKNEIKPKLISNPADISSMNNMRDMLKNSNTIKSLPQKPIIHTPQESSFKIRDEPPWGCLKNGKKPTYSQYRKTLKVNHNDSPIKIRAKISSNKNTISENLPNINNTVLDTSEVTISPKTVISAPTTKKDSNIIERQTKLEKLKKRFKNKSREKRKNKQLVKRNKTIKIHRLGKKKGKGTVGILIKSHKTRKKIKNEINSLKQKSLTEIKLYLKKHNIIKNGSSAPEPILRKLYEDAYTSGDIYNSNSGILIYNYMNN